MEKTNSATLKITTVFCALILCTQISSAQWIMYNFSPQAAYQASYGLTTNTNPSSTNIQAYGWPTNWNNATNRGILAVQFSTNTNNNNVMTCLQPLIYLYQTNPGTLNTNNYQAIPQILLTNTTVTMASSNSNACYILRANYSTNSVYMAGQYSLVTTNATSPVTNTVGTFNSICVGYTTSNIGTNGISNTPTVFSTNGSNFFYPAILQLRISSISGTNTTSTNGATVLNQQLVLPLSINTALTRIVNTNTNFGTNGTPIPTNNIYTNLVKCIRSNSTYTNF